IADLISYRMRNESFVHRQAEVRLPTEFGEFRAIGYTNDVDGTENVALIRGEIDPEKPILVRVHSECLTGDVFGSLRCDCGAQLDRALRCIAEEGRGVLLYLRQEGRGIGLTNKIRAYALQDRGLDTVEANEHLGFPADLRDYGIVGQMLRIVGVERLRLLTNNPAKLAALADQGLEVVARVPLVVESTHENRAYLDTKRHKLGHLLSGEPKDST
ncbi:MAG: GTP cyclohydrolase II, partial [Holophagales bacterium]|nr:GTP cyclohydrolase II [Holophagales bacterium]